MIQDLDSRFPIVNPDGTPSDYFLRLLRDRGTSQTDTETTITALETGKADKATLINTGTGLSGGGDLSADRTLILNAGIDLLTDVDTTTTPPTNGQALVWDGSGNLWKPGTVSGGGGGLTQIGKITVTGAAAASISFTSIPATYDDLIYSARLRGTAAVSALNVNIRLNNDSAANYDFGGVNLTNNAAAVNFTTAATASPPIGAMSGASSINSNKFGAFSGEMTQYANTAMEKMVLAENFDNASNSASGIRRQIWGVNWRSTAAINQVDFLPSSGSFAIGSVVILYGR